MADGTTFINIPRTGSAPEDYLVSGASSIDLLAARADFDGSGAGGDFLPALQIVDEAGQVVATTFGSTVTAGGSASVTFAPFLGRGSGGAGGGIDFNKVNDRAADGTVANYLDIEIIGDGSGAGTEVHPAALSIVNTTSGGGMELVNTNDKPLGLFQEGDGGMLLRNDGAGDSVLSVTTAASVRMFTTGGETQVGTLGESKRLLFYVADGDIYWFQGGDAGSPIMALKWNGAVYDLHLQAGATIIYDL